MAKTDDYLKNVAKALKRGDATEHTHRPYLKALIESATIDWPAMIAMMTVHPARLCTLTGKGVLSPGADADVTIIDPNANWTIDVAIRRTTENRRSGAWRIAATATKDPPIRNGMNAPKTRP